MTPAAADDAGAVRWLAGPSPAQRRLLRRIQTAALEATRLLESSREHWHITPAGLAPQAWFVEFSRITERVRDLVALARDAGLPRPWIDHVRTKGERGIAWHPPRRWPDPGPTDRRALITALAADAQRIRELAVTYAAYRDHAAHDPATATRIRTTLARSRDRLAGVAALAEVLGGERDRVWTTGDTTWVYRLAAELGSDDIETLAARYRAAATPTDDATDRQVRLLDELDLLTDTDTVWIPQPAALVDTAVTALRSLHQPTEHLADPAPGARIDAAITHAVGHTDPTTDHTAAPAPAPAAPATDSDAAPDP
ncbi:hypothetical protein [Nocardia wallacei]|uniref:hypothetical protein n=1 Tax=Nocardia wallacei TaxID=480035 RepID=UPI00245480AE|nr:hypothetical protein [Nocardia wallacei]